MDTIMSVVTWITTNFQPVVNSLIAMLSGLVAICLLIPGEQPEKFLQSVVDFLTKFSKK